MLPPASVKRDAASFASGGYSEVYRATFNDRPVVVKILNVTAQTDQVKLHRVISLIRSHQNDRSHYAYSSSSKKLLDGSGFNTRTYCHL